MQKKEMINVAIFYDGGYFLHVTNYYKYANEIGARIEFAGLHEFIRDRVAQISGRSLTMVNVSEAHFFRGRHLAPDVRNQGDQLYFDRMIDDIMMFNNITTHYSPVVKNESGVKEKGVDVIMALEMYDICIHRKIDYVVLIASDGDHVATLRKIHSLGIPSILLAWEFKNGNTETIVSRSLKETTSLIIHMDEEIDEMNAEEREQSGLFGINKKKQ